MRNPFYRFLVTGTTLFLAWYFLYEFYLRDHSLIDEWIIDHLAGIAGFVLRLFGYSLTEYSSVPFRTHVGIEGAPGVHIGAPCDGLVLFALFTSFILAYPGKWIHRAWYIPCGLILIHLLNALRVAALTIIVSWKQEWLSFNHDYTFTILVYSVVFALWYIWVNRFSTLSTKSAEGS